MKEQDFNTQNHPLDWWVNSNEPQTGTETAESPIEHDDTCACASCELLRELSSNKDLGRIE